MQTTREDAPLSASTRAISKLDSVSFPEGTVQDALFPYITPSGIPFVRDPGTENPNYPRYTIDETADRLRPLDPDALLFVVRSSLAKVANSDFDTWETGLLTFAVPVPTSVHRGNYLRPDEREWYASLPAERKYEWPDGSTVEELADISGVNFEGEKHHLFETPVPSPFAPGTRQHHVSSVIPFIRQGYSIVYLDQTNYVSRQGLDFSEWAQSSFRDQLRELSEERRDELGISDSSSFELREYIRSNDLIDSDSPATDPVFREYFLLQHRRIREFYQEVIAEISNHDFPMDQVSFHPNLGTGPDLRYAPATAVYTADAFDVATFESYGRLPTVPPVSFTDYRYKLFQAAGRFDARPMQFQTELSAEQAESLGVEPREDPYTTLARLQAAVAFSNGGRAAPELLSNANADPHQNLTRWLNIDGTVPDELSTFVDFVRSNRRFIEDVDPSNRVAVVFSLPTMLWNYVPQNGWGSGVHPEEFLDSFIGATSLLRESKLPYDVLVFGQPDLWTDPEQIDRLSTYDTVVLPRTDAISEQQLSGLEDALDTGTAVIVSGPVPGRDAMYRATNQANQLLHEEENVRVLEADPAGRYHRDEVDGNAFINALDEASPRQIRLSTDAAIGVNVLEQRSDDRFIIHLVNYEYDLERDRVRPEQDVDITFRNPPIEPGAARYYREAGWADLDISDTGDGIEVTIPELGVWGFVVVGTDHSVVENGDRSSAEARLDAAASAIEDAAASDRTEKLPTARNHLSNARSAQNYEAFEMVNSAAEKAVEAAEAAYRTPVVGIDDGHGQAESDTGFEALRRTRERYSSYRYERITEWTSDELHGLDVLVVPPAYRFKDAEYGFEARELEVLEQFVATGGSLLVLARGGAHKELNDLLDRFGYSVDPTISFEGDNGVLRAPTNLHPLTKFTPSIDVKFGTPLTSVPPEATVLAESPNSTASDRPMYAFSEHRSGRVAVLSSPAPFTNSIHNLYAARNLLKELGRQARYARRAKDVDQTTSRTTTDDTQTPSTTTETSVSMTSSNTPISQPQPGFGVGAAVGGLAGFTILLKWLLDDESR